MTTTTKSRRLRRENLHRQHKQIEDFLEYYMRDPRSALKAACDKYGRQEFERILRRYISRHTIKSALTFTMKRVLEKEAA